MSALLLVTKKWHVMWDPGFLICCFLLDSSQCNSHCTLCCCATLSFGQLYTYTDVHPFCFLFYFQYEKANLENQKVLSTKLNHRTNDGFEIWSGFTSMWRRPHWSMLPKPIQIYTLNLISKKPRLVRIIPASLLKNPKEDGCGKGGF